MRRRTETVVAAAMAMAACAHEASPPMVTAPSQETTAPSSSAAPVISVAPTASAAPHDPEPQDDGPAAGSTAPLHLPQSDPMDLPRPRCPSITALVKASAVVKREPPSGPRPPSSSSSGVLDIELTVTLPTNPTQVTFVQNHLTVYGGVIVKQTLHPPDRTTAVVLIRPMGTVAREGSLFALFGVGCKAGDGNVRVDMRYALPPHDGDKVTIPRVDSY